MFSLNVSCFINTIVIQHFSTDVHLNTKQAAEASAFTQYLREKLYPAFQYAWWVDDKNYSDLTRPTYAKALCIPFNFYYPSHYQNAAKEMIDALYGEHTDLREIEKTVSIDKSFNYEKGKKK